MSCCDVEQRSWVEPGRAVVQEPVRVVNLPSTQYQRPSATFTSGDCDPCSSISVTSPPLQTQVGPSVHVERREGCPTTSYRDLGAVARDCCAPACSPVRVCEAPRVVSSCCAPGVGSTYAAGQSGQYLSASPTRYNGLARLASAPEQASDWAVVESAPRGMVRHNVLDQGTGYMTADGRYVVGQEGMEDGLLRLPDGRIRYADGTIGHASPNGLKYADGRGSPAMAGLQGSIVMLSDGSTLHPDGTIEYADGTIRKPSNFSYPAGAEYTDQAWVKGGAGGGAGSLGSISQQVAELKAHIEKSDSEQLKEQLRNMETERKIFEKELQVMKEHSVGPNSPMVAEKEDALRKLQEQFLQEVRQNAEARGVLKALQDERVREAETRRVLISEAVLRREQELTRDKERALADVRQRVAQEKDALIAAERANAQRMTETELSAERVRLQAEMQQLQDYAEAERKRADEEHQQACAEREKAMMAEEQLAALRLGTPEKKKKKKKKKGKKGRKGKKKGKAAAAKTTGFGVMAAAARRTVTTTTRTPNVVRKNRVVSKRPARR